MRIYIYICNLGIFLEVTLEASFGSHSKAFCVGGHHVAVTVKASFVDSHSQSRFCWQSKPKPWMQSKALNQRNMKLKWKGKGKGQRKGHYLNIPQMLQESSSKRVKVRGNTSGKGFGCRTNPKDRIGQVMRCLVPTPSCQMPAKQ